MGKLEKDVNKGLARSGIYFIQSKGDPLKMFSIGRGKPEVLFLFKSAADAEEYLHASPHIELPDDLEVATVQDRKSIITLLESLSKTFPWVVLNPPLDFATNFTTTEISFLLNHLRAGGEIQDLASSTIYSGPSQ